ncbi:MAG: oligosaccharide flippase family protein, partial [Patescibacteria group bacterium]
MKETLTQIIKTRTIKDSAISFTGTFVNGLLGLAFYILMARNLGPLNFGIFSVAVATLTLITDISDVGTDTGLVRFIGKYLNSDKLKALRFLKLGLKVKLAAWLGVLVLGWFLAPFVSVNLLNKGELLIPLRLALVGVGGALLFSFATHAVQAIQRFWVWSGLNVGGNLIRLLGVIFLISLMQLNLISGFVVYIAVPFLGFLAGFFFIPSFFKVKNEFGVSKEFF